MTKVLHTIETRGPGGAEILLVNIVKHLQKQQFKNFGFFIKEGWLQEQFLQMEIPFAFVKLNRKFDLLFLFKFAQYVRRSKINVIHAHEFTMSFYACLLTLFMPSLSVVATFHGRHYHSETSIRQLIMRFISRRSIMVTVSNDVKDIITSKSKVAEERIGCIENGIPLQDEGEAGNLREELGLPNSTSLIGAVGRLHPIKGHAYLVEAAEKLVGDSEDYHFVVAGDGGERERLTDLIRQKSLSSRFTLLGNRRDVGNILSSIDIFVLPSLSEGTSLALLEAMSYSLPIVATKVGNNERLITSSGGGVLVGVKDALGLAKGISDVQKMLCAGETFVMNRELVREHYSLDAMMNSYIELYGEQ